MKTIQNQSGQSNYPRMQRWIAALVLTLTAGAVLSQASSVWAQALPGQAAQATTVTEGGDLGIDFQDWLQQEHLRLEGQRLATFQQVSDQANEDGMIFGNDPRLELSTGAQVDASPGIAATSVGAGNLPVANTSSIFLPF